VPTDHPDDADALLEQLADILRKAREQQQALDVLLADAETLARAITAREEERPG
jgi:ABC-type transporter Mla subunit MlaD